MKPSQIYMKDLNYKIKKGLMEGQNKINLDSLVLGEKIESEDALNLPLDLAILPVPRRPR